MAKTLALFACLAVAVVLVAGNQAAEENKKDDKRPPRQTLEDLLYDPYSLDAEFPPSFYYQPSPRIGGFASEGRSFYSNPLRYPFYKGAFGYEESLPQARLNGLGASAINNLLFNNRFSNNNRVRPFASLGNLVPVQWNPNFPNLATTFDSCTAPSGESGICAPGSVCSVFGGRPSGSCGLGGVCCVNAVTTCGSTVTLNNTYWQTPTTVSSPSACGLTINLDSRLVEQKKAICQVRLDFISFTINGPPTPPAVPLGTCNVDYFQTSGSINTAPQICGEAAGQHMYLNVPNSGATATSLQLLFSFGTPAAAAGVTRSWNIKISMLPCGADYLAPTDCLQYFTSTSGRITSFNWRDVNPVEARQLNTQNYNICFRTELISGQRAGTLCLTSCNNRANSFSLTDLVTSQDLATAYCDTDYLLVPGGFSGDVQNDRFCGGAFAATSGAALADAETVCTQLQSFKLSFVTDGEEAAANNGFCLTYQQR